MSDIKLFRIDAELVEELTASAFGVEKGLQALIEKNLAVLLGMRFMASEYSTGRTHGGRIDTLGIDENNCPAIIEYKRSLNENVINQGLFYLDWLLDHRAEFTLLAMKTLGADIESKVDWSAPRLVCIAQDFTRYDEHAVQQIDRNVELIRYRKYESGFLVLELVNATTGSVTSGNGGGTEGSTSKVKQSGTYKTVSQYYEQASPELRALCDSLEAFLLSLGDDVTKKALKLYYAFRRIKNFACVEVHPQTETLVVYAKVDPAAVELKGGFTRDVHNIGHFGTGDLEIRISSPDDLEAAKPLLLKSYESS